VEKVSFELICFRRRSLISGTIYANTAQRIFKKFGEKVARESCKKVLDFSGNSDHIMLGLGLGLRLAEGNTAGLSEHRRLPQVTADHYRSPNPNPNPSPNPNPNPNPSPNLNRSSVHCWEILG